MLKIGLTGGIGSGKTTVGRVFGSLGVPIYDSDARAKALMVSDPAIVAALTELFGSQAYALGELNRGYIASVVFSDADMLRRLNGIVHPAVREDFGRWAAAQSADYVIQESAILFESGFDADMDAVVVVTAPEWLRIRRVVERDHVSEEDVRRRIANQSDEAVRIARANYIITADDCRLVIPQVLEIDGLIRNEAERL